MMRANRTDGETCMAARVPSGNYNPVAKFFHWLIFLLLVAQYAVGSFMPHIGRKALNEGVITFPQLASNGSKWGHEAGDVHNILVYVLLGFIVLHVVGALYHYFIKRDEVLQRMLFTR
jgi:cytochrome b561